ncbi:hypothetical protein [Clostridioides difficile]|uniref:hypothetical protein n=1 Tax=Clostridioides difficile TaxID=1496 RepID=UPI000D1EEF2B|nr:hypothetical protein [Clostridioides difficile]HBE9444684.1 hypothetical protein [Clostridioides difficile]
MSLNLIISIKPKYVEEILNKKKRFEYRKTIFKEDINKIYVYSTSPHKKIVGYFKYTKYLKDNPEYIWNKTKEFSGISKDEYDEYFNNRDIAYAIEINEFIKFDVDINPKEYIDNFIAPQSYKYINKNVFDYDTNK